MSRSGRRPPFAALLGSHKCGLNAAEKARWQVAVIKSVAVRHRPEIVAGPDVVDSKRVRRLSPAASAIITLAMLRGNHRIPHGRGPTAREGPPSFPNRWPAVRNVLPVTAGASLNLLAPALPANVELTTIARDPFGLDMMGRMPGAQAVVHEEGLLRRDRV